LLEEALQRRQVPLPKVGDRAKVRLVARSQDPERDVFEHAALDPTRRAHADTAAVHQHLRQHDRVIRRIAPFLVFVDRGDRRQIHVIDQVAHEVRQVTLGQPVPEARRQQQILLGHVGAIRLGHRPQCSTFGAPTHSGIIDMSQTITRTRS
jgi:hypothetical protein